MFVKFTKSLFTLTKRKYLIVGVLLLFSFVPVFAQLSGTKTIGGTTPDYGTIKAAILDLNIQGVTAPGVTFLIRSGTYNEDSLRIATATSSSSAPIVFKPDAGATVVINVTPPNTTYNFAIKIEATQYVTIDGSNNGTTSRNLTINSNGTSGQRGIWVSGASNYTVIKNCNVNSGKDIASPTSTVRCIDFLYTGAAQDPDNILCENNLLRYAYTGVRMEGNASGDVMENAIVRNNIIDSVGNSGIYGWYQNNSLIYNNDINILRGSSATIYGLYVGSTSSNVKVYANKVHDIRQLSTTSTTYGIYVSTTSTLGVISVYNNFVWNYIVPDAATGTVYGIYSGTANSSTPDVFAFNSVFFSGTSTGNKLSYTFYRGSSTGPVNLYNNIFHNVRTDGTTGIAYAIYKTTAATVLNSNNNNLYVGTPDAQHYTGRISTTNYATLADWRTANSSDAQSFAENTPFVSATNLHIQTLVATQIESGGVPIAGITDDIDGDTRNVTTPDVGGDEFAGIGLDLSPPSIVFTPLQYTSSTSARTLTAVISDPGSGVPTAGIGLPVLYWRINSGTWNASTASYLSGSDYQFTFGTGVAIGDTVKYYICAQDNATTPNVTSNPLAGAGGFTANPPAAATPPTVPASYIITNVSLSGDYTVGIAMFNMITGKNIYFEKVVQKVVKEVEVLVPLSDNRIEKGKDIEGNLVESANQLTPLKQLMEVEETTWIPMEKGKPYIGDLYVKKVEHPEINFPDGIDGIYTTITAAVADLNLRGVAGPVRFLLTDADYSTGETYPITINVANENLPTATNTVTFKPNTGVTSVITGGTAQNIFGIYDDYITFDGSNSIGGSTRDLTIVNTYTGGSFNLVVVLWNSGGKGASNVTIENCVIEGTPTTSSSYGLFLNAAGGDFDNTSFINNKIQNVKIGMQFVGVAGSITNNGYIFGNVIGDVAKPVKIGGILGSQVDNLIIEGNEIIGEAAGNTNTSQYGISLITGSTNSKVRKNNIHDFYYSGTSGYGCFGIRYNSDATTSTEISNNLIHNIKGDGDASSLTYTPAGIYIISGGNVNLYYNSIYMSGAVLGAGTSYNGRSACLSIAAGITLLDIRDNIFQNSMDSFPGSTRINTTYGVYSSSANTAFSDINYNDYFVNGVGPFVGYLGADQADLLAWQTATGKDANSISADPLFLAVNDLQPAYNSPVIGAGTPIAGITTDYLGVTRSATNPSIGAYEQGVITPMSGVYTVGLNDFLQKTGKKIYFEKRTRTVTKDLLANDSYIDLNSNNDEKNESVIKSGKDDIQRFITVTEEYLEMMENGKPFDYSFFKSNQSMGVYPTITSAITDLIARGVSGPVTFLLVDSDYPTETYPLMIPDIVGANGTNTITFKPGPGVQANIPGSITQTTSTFQLGGADWVTIDGSNTVGGTTKDLHITCPLSFPAFHFYGSAQNNTIINTIFDSKNTSTGSGTFLFGATASGDSNYVENCLITKSDTSAVKHGVGVYFFSSNTSTFNKIISCEVLNFNNYGFRPQGAPSTNNLIKGNLIHQTIPSSTSVYGIYVSRQPGLVIEENYILNLHSTSASPSLIGIYYLGSSGNPVDIYVRNNVVSLSADYNQPAGTLRGIDYFAFAANSAEIYFNTIYIGGTGVTGGTTTGLSKRDATTLLKMYDNAVYNTRSNGTGTGKHYAVYFSNTTLPFEMNNNDYYIDGTGGVLGYFGAADVLTLADWQTATSQDANSISADPIFVSNLDYRPQSVSPLLGSGVPVAGITTDILGDPRGTPPTIGAYENGVFVAIAAPTNLVAIPDTFTVDLGWQDNSNNEFGFVIERKDGDSLSVNPFVPIDTVGTNVINYLDTGLSANTTYTYRVYGYNAAGNSGYSNLAQTTTFIPVEFTSFVAEIAGRDVIINWSTATETNNLGFDIERKLDGEWEKIGFKDGKGSTTEPSDYSFIDKFTYNSYKGMITYRLKQMDFDGTYAYSSEIEIDADFTPKEYTLYQNYPNPFNPVTTIKYSLPFESKVRIAVYNILGELVDVVVDELKEVGFHNYNWNASNLASGIYIYTIEAKSVAGDKNYSAVKKMILMK